MSKIKLSCECKKKDFAEFWKGMDAVIGLVPENVKNIFNLLELTATSWLGDMTTRDEIMSLEADIRRSGKWRFQRYDPQGCAEDYFGQYGDKPDQFQFTGVEIKCITAIASAVKQYGFNYFTNVTNVTVNVKRSNRAIAAYPHRGYEYD